jgi:signal transduction histidine kinase
MEDQMSPRKIERTRRDAVDWVDRAMAFYNAGGKEIALAEFMNPKGQFVEDEMYLFVMDSKGVMLAHGANEKFVGKQFIDLKDCNCSGGHLNFRSTTRREFCFGTSR